MSETTDMETLVADTIAEELARAYDKIANLEFALKSNHRIGMAIGILMVTFKIHDDTAFDMLREASQARNRKLRDIAEDVILAGTLEG